MCDGDTTEERKEKTTNSKRHTNEESQYSDLFDDLEANKSAIHTSTMPPM